VIAAFVKAALQRRERGPDGLVTLAAGPHRLLVRPGKRLLRFPARTPQRARQATAATGPANPRHHVSLPGLTGQQRGPQAPAAAGPHSTFLCQLTAGCALLAVPYLAEIRRPGLRPAVRAFGPPGPASRPGSLE